MKFWKKIRQMASTNADLLFNVLSCKNNLVVASCDHTVNISSSRVDSGRRKEAPNKERNRNEHPISITCDRKTEPVSERLKAWRYTGDPILPPAVNFGKDLFDVTLIGYEDVVRLNGELATLAENFSAVAADVEPSRVVLRGLLYDLARLQLAVAELNEITSDLNEGAVTSRVEEEGLAAYFRCGLAELFGCYGDSNVEIIATITAQKNMPARWTMIKAQKSLEVTSELPCQPTLKTAGHKKVISPPKVENTVVERALPSIAPRFLTDRLDKVSSLTGLTNRNRPILPFFKNIKNIECTVKLDRQGHNVWTLAIVTDGMGIAYIATDGNRHDKTISLWNTETMDMVGSFVGHPDGAIYSFVPYLKHNGGQCLASGSDDTTIRLWDINSKRMIGMVETTSRVRSMCAFTVEDGRACLASGGREEKVIRLWNLESKESIGTLPGHAGPAYSLAAYTGPDGGPRLVSGSDDRTIRLWDLRTMEALAVLETFSRSRVTALSTYLRRDGRIGLVSGNNNGRVELRDPEHTSYVEVLEEETGYYIFSFAIFVHGDDIPCLAYGGKGGTIKVWDLESKKLIKVLDLGGEDKNIENLAVYANADGRAQLVSCDRSSTIKIWEEVL
mmetsp:Transcript_40408/g.94944  ORF Transcript_40408/g.94944 Transcript_40408/m.94944 type:complete len:617 (-) Transcript_40408:80-1930(-)